MKQGLKNLNDTELYILFLEEILREIKFEYLYVGSNLTIDKIKNKILFEFVNGRREDFLKDNTNCETGIQ